MTAPRQVLPGASYLVTRRCEHRQFLLRPSATTNAVLEFLLAVAAQRYGIQVHAFCVMSNHYHLVITDPDAHLPAFHQFLDALVARAVNASLGRFEGFWANGTYSAARLVSREDIVEKTAYVLANPVAAGLVHCGTVWPGLWSNPDLFGSATPVRRPTHFFSERGSLPEHASLELTIPPGFASAAEFRTAVKRRLDDAVTVARRRVRGQFLGLARILAQRPTARPSSFEPRRTLNPRIAAKDVWKRIEALTRMKGFVTAYRCARDAWCAGDRSVVFPAGTYLMRVAHGVPCSASG